MDHFKLVSEYAPTGDQPRAIEELVKGFKEGNQFETLLGVTGSGKTFTMANVIQALNKPTLIISHNKTLAGQLYGEMKEFFPENAVEYFVSYYDYYQPEAYVPSSDTYIEKDSAINEEIDKLRLSATAALSERRDVIVVASVSCIYGLGSPVDYKDMILSLRPGMIKDRDEVIKKLVEMQYERNDMDFHRSTFRVHGDVVEIFPANEGETAVRVEFFGDEIDQISEFDPLTAQVRSRLKHIAIFPASHYVVDPKEMLRATTDIEEELKERVDFFKRNDRLLEAQRISERTHYDIEMMRETGFCSGIENYSRHLAGLPAGSPPFTLIDYFPDDFLIIVDESHITLPQVRGMFAGDRSRKTTLVDYGFRLPSALDNRPLKFDEFNSKINQAIYISATPGDYELELVNNKYVEQIIRPTGLLDPTIEVRPTKGQIDDIVSEIRKRIERNERVLITTLTIRMSEELTNYLKNLDIKVAYLHSEIKTLERTKIIRDLRLGKYDVVVGINLLREGIDIPEVSLILILDADKQGFLRSDRSLIQTIGRCARNEFGHVIMYADSISDAMNVAIKETERRRSIQEKYNKEHNIIPKTIQKEIRDLISNEDKDKEKGKTKAYSKKEKEEIIKNLEKEMMESARKLDFERATELRDMIFELKSE